MGLFITGILFGQLWHYLGDKNSIVNRYLEVHNARFINQDDSKQTYYVFYNDFQPLSNFVASNDSFFDTQSTDFKKLATVSIDNSSLPDSLNLLRKQPFIRFIFPGTFPFICH